MKYEIRKEDVFLRLYRVCLVAEEMVQLTHGTFIIDSVMTFVRYENDTDDSSSLNQTKTKPKIFYW